MFSLNTSSARIVLRLLFLPLLTSYSFLSGQPIYYVSPTGIDSNPGTEALPWRTIQQGCTLASPGGSVLIKAGAYNEKIDVQVSGNQADGYITIKNYGSDSVIVDGAGVPGQNMFFVQDKNYLKIMGLIIRNDTGLTDGSGIRIEGSADHIELRNNTIYNIRGTNAMGITCYGTDGINAIANIVIDSNRIFDCDAAPSEALTLNGNIDGFRISGNEVHDINNIGIDMIGGEGMCPVASKDKARNGVCGRNHVYRCRSTYGGGYAAAIYVDGGSTIVVENNVIHESDVGLEIGCENHNRIADSITVRNNLIYNNDKRGLSFGGYNFPSTGQVKYCQFLNNTVYLNDTLFTGDGECHIEYAQNCVVKNNIFCGNSQNLLLTSTVGNSQQNILDYNLWFTAAGGSTAMFSWDGVAYTGFSVYKVATGQDTHSLFDDPQFLNPLLPSPDLHIGAGSPARDSGVPGFVPASGDVDMDGEPRLVGTRVDIGADEFGFPPSPPALVSPPNLFSDQPPNVSLQWEASTGASFYHLQLALDSLFDSPIEDDSTLSTTNHATGLLNPNSTYYWRVAATNVAGSSAWSPVWSFATTGFVTSSYPVAEGWNMISLPLVVFNPQASAVFPAAVSNAYAFLQSTGYAHRDSLRNGIGYWVKFGSAQNVSISGTVESSDTIEIVAGWNLIGGITATIDTGSIVETPTGIIQSAYFGYDGSYIAADSIRSANAYWVKASAPGVVILSGNSMAETRRKVLE